jgi:hypothetical protein
MAPAAAISRPHQVQWARAMRPDNGFSPNGPWNTPLPAKVPLAPNSAAVVHNIVQDVQNNFGFWALNTGTYSSPIFTVGPHTPAQHWTYTNCLHQGDGKAIASSFAHVPTPRHRAPMRPATAGSIHIRPCWTRRTVTPGTPGTSCSTRYR